MTPTQTNPSALLIIDMQQDFFNDPELDGHRKQLVRACNALAASAHEAGALVVEVRTVHDPDRSTWALNMLEDGQGMTLEGTPGAAPVEGLDLGESIIVTKTRDSAFHGTRLTDLLAASGVRNLAVAGVSTESCVAATATDAYAHDVHVVLVEDAIAATDPEAHDNALDRLKTQYRQPAVPSDRIQFEAGRATA
ncbi:MAG: cysteine hydrolase [Marmoricola sp.]|nr:cysteine hydrolase [Marmoricola sp.]